MTAFSAVLSSTVLLPDRMFFGGVMSSSDAPLKILTHFWVFATVGSGMGSDCASGVSSPASSGCSGGVVGSGGTVGAAGVSPSAATYLTCVGLVPGRAQAARLSALVSARPATTNWLRFMIPPVGEPYAIHTAPGRIRFSRKLL
jgi:hypothetical protein